MKCVFIFPILFVLSITACRVNCENGSLGVMWNNFDSADLNLIKVDAYETGSGQTKLKKSIYAGNSVTTSSTDSQESARIMLEANTDYILTMLNSGKTFLITDIGYSHAHYRNGIGEAKLCSNPYSYKVNGIGYEMPAQFNIGAPSEVSAPILIDKNAH